MSVSNNTVKVHPDRGWGFSEQGYIVLGTLLVIAIVVVAGWKLMHRKDTAVEVTSLQTMLSNGVAAYSHRDRSVIRMTIDHDFA